LQDIVRAKLRERWVRVENTHQTPTFSAALTMGRP
jgi:hypothetical protein